MALQLDHPSEKSVIPFLTREQRLARSKLRIKLEAKLKEADADIQALPQNKFEIETKWAERLRKLGFIINYVHGQGLMAEGVTEGEENGFASVVEQARRLLVEAINKLQ